MPRILIPIFLFQILKKYGISANEMKYSIALELKGKKYSNLTFWKKNLTTFPFCYSFSYSLINGNLLMTWFQLN